MQPKYGQFEGSVNDPNTMSFEQLERAYPRELQTASFQYLKTKDAAYFDMHFNGKLSSDGYMEKKDGSPSALKPSMSIGGGKAMRDVEDMARALIRQNKEGKKD
jgi:hypothetical protein